MLAEVLISTLDLTTLPVSLFLWSFVNYFFFLFNTSTSCSFVRDNFFFQVIDIKLFTACEELHLVIKSYCTLRYSIQFSLWEKRLYLRGFDFIQPMLN